MAPTVYVLAINYFVDSEYNDAYRLLGVFDSKERAIKYMYGLGYSIEEPNDDAESDLDRDWWKISEYSWFTINEMVLNEGREVED